MSKSYVEAAKKLNELATNFSDFDEIVGILKDGASRLSNKSTQRSMPAITHTAIENLEQNI